MYQVAVKIPDAVLHDTHMTENQSEQLAKKIVACITIFICIYL